MSCRRWWSLVVPALVLAQSSIGWAQVKPKIMIIFDTSGSMRYNSAGVAQPGDGSELCNSVGQQSRIYQLKTALFDALQGMGNSEIDFALATYPMKVEPNFTPACFVNDCIYQGNPCSGHYYSVPAQSSEHTGTLQAACKISSHLYCTSDADCGTGGKCCLSTNPTVCPARNVCSVHNPSQLSAACSDPQLCPWYPDYKQEVLKVPFGQAIENVLWYLDQKEDTGAVAALSNPEIRFHPNWYTPLGKSLFYAHGYFDKEVALPSTDYRKSCEKLVVAFFTDGVETCNVGSLDPFHPLSWADKLAINPKFKPVPTAAVGVTTHTVGIDIPASELSLLQAMATAGKGTFYNVTGTTGQLKAAFLDIIAKSQPPAETCNGLDDDCDNLVDEDFPQKGAVCNNGLLGVCYREGTYACKPDGTGVVCNAPSATGTQEICNQLDDDCDGAVDEDIPGGCSKLCQPEICNGLDDDCDGVVDNGIASTACGKEVGECKAGVTKCVGGKLICDGGSLPLPEECDGKDNDCDGIRDGMSELCYSFPSSIDAQGNVLEGCDKATGKCIGLCKVGTRLCTATENPPGTWAGIWGTCVGEVGPSKDICDGLDNDCDGTLDEDPECPPGAECINGACSQKCSSGEFNCPKGQLCKNGWCVLDPCDPAGCEKDHPGWICKAGECIDPCANATCDPGWICKKGVCVDQSCYGTGCPPGEKCVQNACLPDPCAGVTCKADEFCSAGKCAPVCEAVLCSAGQICKVVTTPTGVATQCVADACAEVSCPAGTVCSAGKCINNPCAGSNCPAGKVCIDGTCVADPCELVRCPGGYQCRLGNCEAPGAGDTVIIDTLATGGGGCTLGNLDRGPAPGLPSFLLMLGLLMLAFTRRTWRD